MSVLVGQGLTKYHGAQEIFSDLSVRVGRGDRIGLVGPNGVGKTTLLRILAGLEQPTGGTVDTARRLRVGYLPQNPSLDGDRTVYGEMLVAFEHLLLMEERLRALELAMSDPVHGEKTMRRYSALQERYEMAGGYEFEVQIRRVLDGLGFKADDYGLPLSRLSGGQRTRSLLARLLLEEPDLLLLDEPTNHLDIEALEWLEGYLSEWPHSLIVVAHERQFLTKVTNRIWEMEDTRLEEYPGNYGKYVGLREQRRARRESEYRAQREVIARTEEFIRRHKAGQRSKQARGRQTLLDRVQRLERPKQARSMGLSMGVADRTGEFVLTTADLVVGYTEPAVAGTASSPDRKVGPHPLFACPSVSLRRQERVVLMGPNGSGKTTFLRTILGEHPPLHGSIALGHNVRPAHLEQAYADLDLSATILDFILGVKNTPIAQARDFLARYLFTGDDIFKPIRDLSGGERARVSLAAISLKGANFLLLDEPTTHLDLVSQEVLQRALSDFDGALLIVSHDRYLANAIATQIWEIRDRTLCAYEGNYEAYLVEREKERSRALAVEGRAASPKLPEPRAMPRPNSQPQSHLDEQISETESRIRELEAELLRIQGEISAASAAQDPDALQSLARQYQQLESELDDHLERWTELEETRDKA